MVVRWFVAAFVVSAVFGGPEARVQCAYAAAHWSITVPPEWHGPLDTSLPEYGRVLGARVCPGDGGQVGVVWVRELDHDRLEWDQVERVWRVEGSASTLRPAARQEVDPSEFWPYPALDDVFQKGQFVGMCVLSRGRVEASGFLPDVGADSGFQGCLVGPVSFGSKSWQVPLAMWPSSEVIRPTTHGIAFATFDATGWTKPVLMIAEASPSQMWAFTEGGQTDLFWLEYYWPPPDFFSWLIDGDQRQGQRIKYTGVVRDKAGSIRVAYDSPSHPRWAIESEQEVVPLGRGRFDLMLCRDTDPREAKPDDLMHVPNLLRVRHATPVRVGTPDLNSCVVTLPLSAQRLQVIWLEEMDVSGEQCMPRPVRLMEVHLTADSWSTPSQLFEPGDWKYDSLAAASLQLGGDESILAVWCGEGDRLTYTLKVGSGGWSDPVVTRLALGRSNWLVNCQDGLVLVTQMKRNLYWCVLTLAGDKEEKRARDKG